MASEKTSPNPPLFNDRAAATLDRAKHLVTGDRGIEHGNAFQQHAVAAGLWTNYLGARGKLAREIEPYEVAMMMALLKISRDAMGSYNADTFVDLCGYAALGHAVRQQQIDMDNPLPQEASPNDDGA
jgi:hypothetical protein